MILRRPLDVSFLACAPLFADALRPPSFQPLVQRRSINRYAKVVPAANHIPSPLNDPSHPIDEAIRSRMVNLVTPQGFVPNQSLASVLHPLNRKEQLVRQVSVDPRSNLPIVKIVRKQALLEEHQNRLKLLSLTTNKTPDSIKKELDLSWTIDRINDLQHRLRKLREWLADGRPVEVLIAPKRKARLCESSECEELIAQVREAAARVEGTRELKEMDGKIGAHVILYFAPQEQSKAVSSKLEAIQKDRAEKKARKEQERKERKKELEEKQRRREERAREQQRQREDVISAR